MSSVVIGFALAIAAVLVVAATYAALRPRAASFGWALVGGLAFALLAMAAAARVESGSGLRAAVLQLVTVALAGGAGLLGASRGEGGTIPPLGRASRMVAWLALVGLPPTIGFHAKVSLYESLLGAGWWWAAALAMIASWALLIPALGEWRSSIA